MLINVLDKILNNFDTLETSPKQTAFDLELDFLQFSHLFDPLSHFGEKIKINNWKLLICLSKVGLGVKWD